MDLQVQRYEDELEAQALSLEAMSAERETARSSMQVRMPLKSDAPFLPTS
jgi:hypothetical protein